MPTELLLCIRHIVEHLRVYSADVSGDVSNAMCILLRITTRYLCWPRLAKMNNLQLQCGLSPVPVAGETPFLSGHPSRELV